MYSIYCLYAIIMHEQAQAIFLEVIRQVFGGDLAPLKPRRGTLILTRYTAQKMGEYKIDGETLENAFRFGVEYRTGKIIHKYARYCIGLYYKAVNEGASKKNQMDKSFVITTCWKGGVKGKNSSKRVSYGYKKL